MKIESSHSLSWKVRGSLCNVDSTLLVLVQKAIQIGKSTGIIFRSTTHGFSRLFVEHMSHMREIVACIRMHSNLFRKRVARVLSGQMSLQLGLAGRISVGIFKGRGTAAHIVKLKVKVGNGVARSKV